MFFTNVRKNGLACFAAATLLFCSNSQATPASVAGSYSGTGSGSDISCPTPPEETFTFNWSLNITQDGNQIEGDGQLTSTDADGEVDTSSFVLSGNVDADGNISNGGFLAEDLTDGYQTWGNLQDGKFTGNQLSTKFTGTDDDGCSLQGSFTGSTAAVDPATSGGAAVTGQAIALNSVQVTLGKLGSRTMQALGRNPASDGGSLAINEVGDNGIHLDGQTGLAAGDVFGLPFGIWGSFTYSSSDSDHPSVVYEVDRKNFLGGVDILPLDNLVVGLALGYETADVDTDFNLGSQEVDGITFAPYIGWQYTAQSGLSFGLDASGGYTNVDMEQDRTDAVGAKVTSELDADRFFWAANATLSQGFDQLFLSARTGVLWAREEQDGYVESDGTTVGGRTTRQNQWTIGAEAAYGMGNFEPYANITYERDFNVTETTYVVPAGASQPFSDEDDVRGGLGLRYFNDNGVSGNIEWNRVFGRDDYDEDNFSIFIRVDM